MNGYSVYRSEQEFLDEFVPEELHDEVRKGADLLAAEPQRTRRVNVPVRAVIAILRAALRASGYRDVVVTADDKEGTRFRVA
ncbi:hypothetical protein ACFTWH_08390 [Streptomyces sp. NPDC057011]|uniref:hypothetical protein n=1 Tax=unclassified Streptomyces TaxID=2593676 RepID=UPI0036320EF7